MKLNKRKIRRFIAIFLAANIFIQSLAPLEALALTSGPSQPEFSSFEPVVTTGMVNDFSGSFMYNLPVLEIPGPDGGGYSMSLSYHSGTTPEEEASWVGYGWTLNPGSINRSKRGFPDDIKGDKSKVKYWNKMPKNWTISANGNGGFETFGVPTSLSSGLRYNNYKGLGFTGTNVGFAFFKGLTSLSLSVADGEFGFSASIKPGLLLSRVQEKLDEKATIEDDKNTALSDAEKKARLEQRAKNRKTQENMVDAVNLLGSSIYGLFTHGLQQSPTNISQYMGESYNFTYSLQLNTQALPVGPYVGLSGNYTQQSNIESDLRAAHGYMYSASAQDADMMDYYTEKDLPYDKKTKYLGIPFSNADNFMATGEGLVGGFRMYNRKAGTFHVNSKTSMTEIFEAGASGHLGNAVGPGISIGIGSHTLSIDKWGPGSSFSSREEGDEGVFFRFNNDQGGDHTFSSPGQSEAESVRPVTTALIPDLLGSNVNKVKSLLPAIDYTPYTANQGNRSGRSSYIGYTLNSEMAELSNGLRFRSYSQENLPVKRTDDAISAGVGEFAMFNEQGNRYVYGLPVYSRNELRMHYGLKGVPDTDIQNEYLVKRNITGDLEVKVGEEHNYPYANTYLLTSITTPDYVDRTMDGPSQDDFGGYTRFSYKQLYGSTVAQSKATEGSWYRWRVPYNALSLSRNDLSTKTDDIGAVLTGEKEIYYLETAETRTHIAVFVTNGSTYTLGNKTITGSPLEREDAYEANSNAVAANSFTTTSPENLKKLKRLERIELYSKPMDGSSTYKLVKTVHFSYDYSLQKGLPNAVSGKLTLRKVWFEYEGIVNARISPYKFSYEYRPASYFAPEVQSRYPSITGYGSTLTAAAQNPNYSPYDIDPWGNYQKDGAARHSAMIPWVSQKAPAPDFDPAAWQLKSIQLPSGGEILVQYEQGSYSYVQDRRATGMVSIDYMDGYKIFLKASDMDVSTPAELARLRDLLQAELAGRKVYFRFLYRLLGTGPCSEEYITGYTDVKKADIESGKVYIELDNKADKLPDKLCREFFRAERSGQDLNSCNTSGGITNNEDFGSMLYSMLASFASYQTPFTICQSFDASRSYLKVPLLKPKKGGSVRVKRILTYDSGIESGDASLYGSEYIYETTDLSTGEPVSSGVAANEPAEIREENALTGYLEKNEPRLIDKLRGGLSKDQSEGPLGESLLPSPSIGYSVVAVRNIHEGGTSPGFMVNEYYTAKDYPYDKVYPFLNNASGVQAGGLTEEDPVWRLLPTGLINYSYISSWLTQGYSFVLNSMHGQIRKTGMYAGNYSPDPEKWICTSSQEYSYFEPGEALSMMYDFGDVRSESPGKEAEMVFESRAVQDITKEFAAALDFTVGFIPIPIPFITGVPSLSYTESNLRTHVTTKVTRYPAILKAVKSYKNKVFTSTENLVFDKRTGKPVVMRMVDEYGGTMIRQSIPAAMIYSGMGQRALNERKVFAGNAQYSKGPEGEFISFPGVSGTECADASMFTRGDLIRIRPSACNLLYHVERVDLLNDRIQIIPSGAKNASCVLPASASVTSVEVLKSGYTNQLDAQAGEIAFHSTSPQYSGFFNGFDKTLTGTDAFTTALNAALDQQIAPGPASNGSFTLAGPFNDMSLPADICAINGICSGTSGLRLSNIRFNYTFTGKGLRLNVESLTAFDPAANKTVNINCLTQPVFREPLVDENEGVQNTGSQNARVISQCNFPATPRNRDVLANQTLYGGWEAQLFGPLPGSGRMENSRINMGETITWSASFAPKTCGGICDEQEDCGRTYRVDYVDEIGNYEFTTYLPGPSNGTQAVFKPRKPGLHKVEAIINHSGNCNSSLFEDSGIKLSAYVCVGPHALDFEIQPVQDFCNSKLVSLNAFNRTDTIAHKYYKYNFSWDVQPLQGGSAQFVYGKSFAQSPSLIFSAAGQYRIRVDITESNYNLAASFERIVTVKNCQVCNTTITGPSIVRLFGDASGCLKPATANYKFQHPDDCSLNTCKFSLTNPAGNSVEPLKFNALNCASKGVTATFSTPGEHLLKAENTNPASTDKVTVLKPVFVLDSRPARADFVMERISCPGKVIRFRATPVCNVDVDEYVWDFGDGSTARGGEVLHTFADCLPHTVSLSVTNQNNPGNPNTVTKTYAGNAAEANTCHPICECVTGISFSRSYTSGSFTASVGRFYTSASGAFVFKENTCSTITPLECISKCSNAPTVIPDVVQASAAEFSDEWEYSESEFVPSTAPSGTYSMNANSVEKGKINKWRPKNTYVYRSPISQRSDAAGGGRAFNSGTFSLEPFRWGGANDPDTWIRSASVTRFTPHGMADEEKDVQDIFSSVKYGYNKTLPVVVAQNAKSGSVLFESFEEGTGAGYSTTFSHSGKRSLSISNTNTKVTVLKNLVLSDQMFRKDLLIRFWVIESPAVGNGKLKVSLGAKTLPSPRKVAQTGQWALYETRCTDFSGFVVNASADIAFASFATLFIDDVVALPADAYASCFVYDLKTLRLITSFDDQHFGTHFQYNAEGQLVRRIAETERGMKTIKETQYNTPKQSR